MRRWNGWGDDATTYHLPDSALSYLTRALGEPSPSPDATLEQVLNTVPETRLIPHALIHTDPDERLRHARGQSLPDWVALRSGRIGVFPDGVAYPTNEADIRTLFAFAQANNIRLIPYGGGTSVVGHINPLAHESPYLTLDLGRMNQLVDLDEESLLATFGAGVRGPDLEAQLLPHGYTLGHYPQSWELSTLGGWIATRSSGQQSYHYGRIERLFAAGHVETPCGALDLPPFPASAAGPELRELMLGSEGRLGVITQATVRIRPVPEIERFYAAFFHDFKSGAAAVREASQAGFGVSMLRLSDAQETETTLMLAGKERLAGLADRGLRLLRYGPERCMLVYGITGDRGSFSFAKRQMNACLRYHGAFLVDNMIGTMWRKSRFLTPYLRNTLWERGYAIDTLETALPWRAVLPAASAIKAALQEGSGSVGERALVFSHLSHTYRDGASVYVTYIFRRAQDPDETLSHWRALKGSASRAVIAAGGTISHQHGVGKDHAPYLPYEKGEIGMALLHAAKRWACSSLVSIRTSMGPHRHRRGNYGRRDSARGHPSRFKNAARRGP
jgi:alkyldihydroxyacetonephosphate synthase